MSITWICAWWWVHHRTTSKWRDDIYYVSCHFICYGISVYLLFLVYERILNDRFITDDLNFVMAFLAPMTNLECSWVGPGLCVLTQGALPLRVDILTLYPWKKSRNWRVSKDNSVFYTRCKEIGQIDVTILSMHSIYKSRK